MLRILITLFITLTFNVHADSSNSVSNADKTAEEIAAEILKSAHERYVEEQQEKERVVMYATQWCGYCKKARQYFKDKGIVYTEYDIDSSRSAKREYDRLGGSGVPLIIVDGHTMRGFSAKHFDQLYKLNK